MSGKSTIDQIRHYQKDIEKCPDNAERMLRCIHRLYVLPITLEHLQETGVGRSVNSLRKYKGEVGDAAKALVTKWKAMVAAEESEEEPPPVPPSKPRENKVKSPPPVKSERKSDHHCKENKEKSKSKEIANNNNNTAKHHSHKKTSHEKSHSSNSSRSPEKNTDSKSSLKRSHSSSSSSSHKVEKDNKSSNHKNSKTHHEKKHKIEDEENSPPPEKKHKSHSHSKDQSSKKRIMSSESEEESDASDKSEAEVESDPGSPARDSEEESEAPSESSVSKSEAESDSNSDSDHRHRSKKHSSSHHNHKHSSHSKDRDKEKKKQKEQNQKEKEKNKENHSYNKHSEKHSSKKRSSSPDYKELIKENEKKIKKEKKEEFVAPKIVPTKPIKIETNEDGSIDSGSGASFADALLGMDVYEKKKCKKTTSSTSSSSSKPKSSKSSSSTSKNEEKPKLSKPSSSKRSIDELVEPPELLTKTVKLEALDLDISSTLPEINPNYKPLPHVPERMRQAKFMSAEDHMFSIMSTKNQRTKVFSGNKSALTSVPTLFSMCIQLLYDNIDAVEYTGGVPYQLLKPLLQKLNADQLYVLEHFNPYLVEDTDELWKFHAQKEFRNEKRQDMESWRELYVRCMDERERKLKALTANITQSMANSTPVRQAKLAYVDAVVKPPRNIARKQAKFGTGNASSPTKNPTKHEIVSKAVVGGNTPGLSVKDTVPPPPVSARAAVHHPTPAILKKKKAPLMQKALQVMKGTRYKR